MYRIKSQHFRSETMALDINHSEKVSCRHTETPRDDEDETSNAEQRSKRKGSLRKDHSLRIRIVSCCEMEKDNDHVSETKPCQRRTSC